MLVSAKRAVKLWLTWVVPREFPLVPFCGREVFVLDNRPRMTDHSMVNILEARMLEQLNEIEKSALESLQSINDQTALDAWRIANTGRSSPLMQVFAGFGKLSKEDKPVVGAVANRVKVALESALAERAGVIKNAALEKSLEEEKLDVTLPGRTKHIGRLHPSTQQLRRVLAILAEMGFQVYTSREVETDDINFQMLNFPPHHPARGHERHRDHRA